MRVPEVRWLAVGAGVGVLVLPALFFKVRPLLLAGNRAEFAPHLRRPSALAGVRAYVLGSSVAFGSAARGLSFADDLADTYGVIVTKEAVPGTTLSTAHPNSYVERLERLPDAAPDVLIVQLSTNDAARPDVTLGQPHDIEPVTASGALATIVARGRERWGAGLPILVFTGSRFSPKHPARRRYEDLVALARALADREGVALLDLYHATLRLPDGEAAALASFTNDVPAAQRRLFLADDIHPTRAGYRDWWTPAFVEALTALLTEEIHENRT